MHILIMRNGILVFIRNIYNITLRNSSSGNQDRLVAEEYIKIAMQFILTLSQNT